MEVSFFDTVIEKKQCYAWNSNRGVGGRNIDR